jgi:hypothetical protein
MHHITLQQAPRYTSTCTTLHYNMHHTTLQHAPHYTTLHYNRYRITLDYNMHHMTLQHASHHTILLCNIQSYLREFPRIDPRDFGVTGEASPAYIYSPSFLLLSGELGLELGRCVACVRILALLPPPIR